MTMAPWLRRGVLVAATISVAATASFAQTTPAAGEAPTDESTSGKVEALNEQVQVMQTDVDKLKKFKFSGYIQARWEHSEDQSDTVRVAGATISSANRERFYIRRARVKLTYDSSPLSQGVVYIDAGADRQVRLLEAYLTLLDPWTPDHRHALTIGQMNVPFGYEIERSSSVRELPERSRVENVLFPGERDRGAKIVSAWSPQLETVVAIVNGPGINSVPYGTIGDPTDGKDFVGRVRVSQGTFDVAGSYYDGLEVVPLTGGDIQVDKTRIGGDAQLYYAAPSVGGGSLKGELYAGKNLNADSVRVLVPAPTGANPTLLRAGANPAHLATDFIGWYAMWVQNLGEKFQLAARYEQFDPNTDIDHDQFERWNVGLNFFYDGFTRLTAAWEMPITDRAVGTGFVDPDDNLWTVQFQHKF